MITKPIPESMQATDRMEQLMKRAWLAAEGELGIKIPKEMRDRLANIMTAYGAEMLRIGYRAGIRKLN